MKIFVLLLITLATLTVVPTANASQPPPPVGTTVCDQNSKCLTVGVNDCIKQTGDYPQFNTTNYEISQFQGIAGMCGNTRVGKSGMAGVQVKNGAVAIASVMEPEPGSMLYSYCQAYYDADAATPVNGAEGVYDPNDSPARMDTPQALFDTCNASTDTSVRHFTRWANQPYVPAAKPVADPEAAEPVATPTAQKTTKCDAVAFGKAKVAVTALGINCNSGRNMLARYLRRGVEPKGYVCVTAKAGKVRVATCGTPGKAATKVTGRWRG